MGDDQNSSQKPNRKSFVKEIIYTRSKLLYTIIPMYKYAIATTPNYNVYIQRLKSSLSRYFNIRGLVNIMV